VPRASTASLFLSISLSAAFAAWALACGGVVETTSAGLDAGADGHGSEGGSTAPHDAQADSGHLCVPAHRVIAALNTPSVLATDATHLFWFDDAEGTAALYVTDKCAPGPVTLLAKLPKAGADLTVDSTTLYLTTLSYDSTTTQAAVYAIAKSDGSIRKLVDVPKGSQGIATQDGWVYWTESETNRVGRVRANGTNSAPDYLPFGVQRPWRVAVLDDSTVCVLGQTLECRLPAGMRVTVPVPRASQFFLSSDGAALYLASTDNASVWSIVRVVPGAASSVQDLAANPGDAGSLPLSGVVALPEGVYVASGTGTLQWFPRDGRAPAEEKIAGTLPPFIFFADSDGIYWDALNGLEMGPPLAE
jgi:hypothetical protein